MALATDGYWLTVSLVDNGGNVSTLRYELTSADAATAVTDAATIIAALDAVTNAVISNYSWGERFAENAFAYPAAGIENEDKASVTVLLDGAGAKKANFKIPAPVIGVFMGATGPSANEVDVLDAALVTYGGIFEAGGEAYISDGETMDSMLNGKRISAGSQKG